MPTGFHEIRFPDDIAYGATGGPEYATDVVATGSGFEQRNVRWAQPRGRWDVASGIKKRAQMEALIAFFRARKGRAYGFRFKDWSDYRTSGQPIGSGDGTTVCAGHVCQLGGESLLSSLMGRRISEAQGYKPPARGDLKEAWSKTAT